MPAKKIIQNKINVAKPKTAKKLYGVATRDSLDKTVPVEVTYTKTHHLYGKRFKVSKKVLAHTEIAVKRGQNVVIIESRQISKNKTWVIKSINKDKE